MKRNLLKFALCAMALLPLGAWADGDFGTEEVVSTTTTWIFNDYTTSAVVSTCAADATKPQTDKLYKRSATSGRGFTISEISSTDLTIHGHKVSVTKYAQTTGNFSISSVRTAGAVGNNATAAFAFNASVPGTVYVLMQESAGTHSSEYRQCIYFSTPSTDMAEKVRSEGAKALGIEEVSWTSTEAGSFYIGSNTSSKIYAIRFVPTTYTLDITAENGTVSRSPEKTKYDYNDVVTLTATPADGYKFVSWSGVGSSTGATATVTMTENKTVTATFAKAAVTTVWNFEQYVKDNEAILYDAVNSGATAAEFIDGLYFHTRNKKDTNHAVRSKKAKVTNADLETHFGTYKRNNDYMGALLGTGGGTAPGNVEAGTCTTIDGISFKAPSAGKFYATVVRSSNTTVYVYKNGTEAASVTFSDEVPAKEFEIEVSANDNIYLFVTASGGKQVYLWNAGFIPTTADAATKTVTISSAGYATFCSTHNYTLPSGLKAYIVNEVSLTAATMQEVTDIPACTGVILKGDEGSYTLTSTETPSTSITTNYLKANLADYQLPADDGTNYNYTLAAGPVFKHVASTGTDAEKTLAAGKAFLRTTVNVTSGGGSAPALNLVFGGITGISETVVKDVAGDGQWYTLSGQRVTAPGKGIYIKNGKKYIIK